MGKFVFNQEVKENSHRKVVKLSEMYVHFGLAKKMDETMDPGVAPGTSLHVQSIHPASPMDREFFSQSFCHDSVLIQK